MVGDGASGYVVESGGALDDSTAEDSSTGETWLFPPGSSCLGVSEWNGDGGTFAAGPDGTVQGSWGLSSFAAGTVELTIAEPYVPEAMWLDLQTEDGGTILGLADLGTCFNPPRLPCE